MQRSEKEIKEREEIEHILEKADIGRLGTCSKGEPYVVPLSFAYRDGKIVFHCARRGKKLDNIAKNPRVCFEADLNGGEASITTLDHLLRPGYAFRGPVREVIQLF